MVGLAGAVGDFDRDTSVLSEGLRFLGDEHTDEHEAPELFVASVSHPVEAEPQPVRLGTDELLWLWGSVYGYRTSGGDYVSKRETAPSLTNAEYCARLFEQYGWEFVAGLNGSFVGVLFDEDSRELHLFTDRLGSRPIHYTVVEEGVVFSTQVQPLCVFLADRLSFDREFLAEYLSFERSLGLKTPIDGVERAHPGGVTRINLDDRSVAVDVKWRPVHRPIDRPFEYFVDRFAEYFEAAVKERYDPDRETGVLLSGGSDSRLLLGAMPDRGVTAYHINDWQNREAKIAAQIADASGKPFVFLERGEESYRKALEFSSAVSNYTSWFQHGHASGLVDVLGDRCDLLMTAHYSDTLFKHNYLPYRGLLVPGTSIEVPVYVERRVETVDDLVEMYLGTRFHNRKHLRAPPDYLQIDDLRPILANNITDVRGGVDHHGVLHQSPHDAGLFSESYPLTNSPGRLFFDVMLQAAAYRNPFLDVRLIELMTRLPTAYRLRENIINASIGRIQRDLAELPHPNTNVALKYPFVLQYLALLANWLTDRFSAETPPRPYCTNGSWPNWDELVRYYDFVEPVLEEQTSLLEGVEWIDTGQLWDDYDRHMEGTDRFDELSSILSFLSIPATQTLLEGELVGQERLLARED